MKTNHLSLWATGLLLTSTLLSSCKKDLEQTTPAQPVTNISSDSTGVIKQGTFRGTPITYKEINGEAILEGDILLSKDDLSPVGTGISDPRARPSGAGLANKEYRWQNWIVPYQIGANLDNAAINKAIKDWEDKTPIRFVIRTNQPDYVQFVQSTKANLSAVGRQGGKQEISLLDIHDVGTIVHEIGHAVGLFHEHTRRDRDAYIDIHWDNIWPDKREYFNRWPLGDGFDYGYFDYSSVMMYAPNAFSQNGQATITRKDGQNWIPGSRLSNNDVSTVRSMYSNLYLIKAGGLYSVNPKDGSSAFLGNGWTGAAKTLAENDQHIWGIQGGGLWKTFRFNGGYEQVGTDDWTGAKGLTGQDAQGNFYAVYQNKLYKINKYGQRSVLGSRNWPSSAVRALYYHNNALYIAWGLSPSLSKVNTTTGEIEKSFGGVSWYDTRGIAAVASNAQYLYVMRKDNLFRVDTYTGAVEGGEYFADVKAMTGVAGYLYIVSGNDLIKMDESSNKQIIGTGWSNTESIGATRNPKLIE